MWSATVLLALAHGFSPACGPGYSCCCMHDLFIPVSCDCVEDEPDTTDNCKRDEFRVKASMADAVVMKGKVCRKGAPRVSRNDLLHREAAARAWARNATQCSKRCVTPEKTFYDKQSCENNDPYKSCEFASEVDPGCQCVCPFPDGRNGTGACVPCPHGYVNKTSEPGAKTFANGEFHCAPALVELVV